MIEAFEGSQVLLLSAVLIAACLSKLTIREPLVLNAAREPGPPTAHDAPRGVPDPAAVTLRDSPALTVGLAIAEGSLGVALMITSHPCVRLVTIMGFASATWVVSELRTRRPEGGCGCFGALSTGRVEFRSVARAGLFTGCAIIMIGVPRTGLDVLRSSLGWVGVVLVVEFTVFLSLSPEIGVLLTRRRSSVPCELRTGPLTQTYERLHASEVWREHSAVLTSTTPVDVWRELCWRLLAYPGRVDGRDVEIVFAVSMARRRPEIRSSVVDLPVDLQDAAAAEDHVAPALSRTV